MTLLRHAQSWPPCKSSLRFSIHSLPFLSTLPVLTPRPLCTTRRREKRVAKLEAGPWASLIDSLAACLKPASGPLRVVITGAPASGKGTQCERIIERYGLVHLSTGDMLRAAVKAGTAVGMQAKEKMQNGELVPDGLVIAIVLERLQEADCVERGWLLDGFPRTASQADALRAAGQIPSHVCSLEVPDAVLVERVSSRRLDPETGKIVRRLVSILVPPVCCSWNRRSWDALADPPDARTPPSTPSTGQPEEQHAGAARGRGAFDPAGR